MSTNPKKTLLKEIFLRVCRLVDGARRNFHHIPVLCYHRVLPDYVNGFWSVLPEQFESQLQVLRTEGFQTLSLTQYERLARGVEPLRERAVLLTFDDGFADNYSIAWKVAQKYNIKINLFICTGIIGQESPSVMGPDGYLQVATTARQRELEESVRTYCSKLPQMWRPLTWQELREMQESGVEFGFHSHSHRNLALLNPQELITDTTTGLRLMERELGQRPRYFAFPYGSCQDYNPQVVSSLTSLGMDLIFAVHSGRTRLPSRQAVFPRTTIANQDDLGTFRQKIWGCHDRWQGLVQLKRTVKRFLKNK